MYYQNNMMRNNEDRIFPFAVPFLFGALAGGAAVGISRPRPVYVTGGYYQNPYYYGTYYPRPYFY